MVHEHLFPRKTSIAILTVMLHAVLCAQIHVDAMRGDDASGTGTSLEPYKTMEKAVSASVALEHPSIIVRGGGSISLAGLPAALKTASLIFEGDSDQTIVVPPGGESVGDITINKTSRARSVTISGGDLTCTGVVTFINGLIRTGEANALVLTNIPGATGLGFVRTIATGGASHVVGNVRQNLKYSNEIAYTRNEFPVGDSVNYRPAALTFHRLDTAASGRFGIIATVSHTPVKPAGRVGLPIVNGIKYGEDILRYPSFFWTITTDAAISPSIAYTMDLSGAGYNSNEFTVPDIALNRVKIIRRVSGPSEVLNSWLLHGNAGSYDNMVVNGVPTVIAVNASGGLTPHGAVFTYGLGSPNDPLPPVTGRVLYDASTAYGIGQAVVTLSSETRAPQTVTADSTGAFSFSNVEAGAYTITASKSGSWAGANSTDALMIVRAYAGLGAFDSLQTAAADVDKSGSSNATDALLIVKRYAGLATGFVKGDWVFESKSITVGTSGLSGLTVKGIATGDVNKSDVPSGANF